MFGFLDVPVSGAHHLVSWLASVSYPLTGQFDVALAIIVFTACGRLLLLPLSRAAVRGERARAALLPQVQELRERHRDNGPRLREEMTKLQQETGTSMFVGCLPTLLQLPVFMVMYRLFSSTVVGGRPNSLLAGTLFGTPLGDHFHGPVFIGLAALLAAVAWFSSRWQAKMIDRSTAPATGGKLVGLLPYGTVLATAVVPLAAVLYLLTTTTWSVIERAMLRREPPDTPSSDSSSTSASGSAIEKLSGPSTSRPTNWPPPCTRPPGEQAWRRRRDDGNRPG